jgi:hypothetical protein
LKQWGKLNKHAGIVKQKKGLFTCAAFPYHEISVDEITIFILPASGIGMDTKYYFSE